MPAPAQHGQGVSAQLPEPEAVAVAGHGGLRKTDQFGLMYLDSASEVLGQAAQSDPASPQCVAIDFGVGCGCRCSSRGVLAGDLSGLDVA